MTRSGQRRRGDGLLQGVGAGGPVWPVGPVGPWEPVGPLGAGEPPGLAGPDCAKIAVAGPNDPPPIAIAIAATVPRPTPAPGETALSHRAGRRILTSGA